jgi:hypothetical protein
VEAKSPNAKAGHQGAALFASQLPKKYSQKEAKDWEKKRSAGSFLPWLSTR